MTFSTRKTPKQKNEDQVLETAENFCKIRDSITNKWQLRETDWGTFEIAINAPDNTLQSRYQAIADIDKWLTQLLGQLQAGDERLQKINTMISANSLLQAGQASGNTTPQPNTEEKEDTNLQNLTNALITLIPSIKHNSSGEIVGHTELSWEALLDSAVRFVCDLEHHLEAFSARQTEPDNALANQDKVALRDADTLLLNITILKSDVKKVFNKRALTERGQAIERMTSQIADYRLTSTKLPTHHDIAAMYRAKAASEQTGGAGYSKAAPDYLRQQMQEALLEQLSQHNDRYQSLANNEERESEAEKLLRDKIQAITDTKKRMEGESITSLFAPLFATALTVPSGGEQDTTASSTVTKHSLQQVLDTPRAKNPLTMLGVNAHTTNTIVRDTIEKLLTDHSGSPLKHYQILDELSSNTDLSEADSSTVNAYIANLTLEINLLRKATFTFMNRIGGVPTVTGRKPAADEKNEAFCLLAHHANKQALPDNHAAYAALLYMLRSIDSEQFEKLKRFSQASYGTIYTILKNCEDLPRAKTFYETKISPDQRSRVMQDLLELYITSPKVINPKKSEIEQDKCTIRIIVAFNATMMPEIVPPIIDQQKKQAVDQLIYLHVLGQEKPQIPSDRARHQKLESSGEHEEKFSETVLEEKFSETVPEEEFSETTSNDEQQPLLPQQHSTPPASTTSTESVDTQQLQVCELRPYLQTAIRRIGNSDNPLQSLANLAIALLAHTNKQMLSCFTQALAKSIGKEKPANIEPVYYGAEIAKRSQATTPLTELFFHVQSLAAQNDTLPDVRKAHDEIASYRDDAFKSRGGNENKHALYSDIAHLKYRVCCALMFVNAVQNAIRINPNETSTQPWLDLLCEQLSQCKKYLDLAKGKAVAYKALSDINLRGRGYAIALSQKQEETVDKTTQEIGKLSKLTQQCAKQTASHLLARSPNHLQLIEFSKQTLSPTDIDFADALNRIRETTPDDADEAHIRATMEYTISTAIFSEHFPDDKSVASMQEYLAKPIKWLEENHRSSANNTVPSELEQLLQALCGANGVTNIENHINLIDYYSASGSNTPINRDAAYLIADFMVKNSNMFDGVTDKEVVINKLNEARLKRALAMPEIRDRAFDAPDSNQETPLDKLSQEQLLAYVEGITLTGQVNGKPKIMTMSDQNGELLNFTTRDTTILNLNAEKIDQHSNERKTLSCVHDNDVKTVVKNVFYILCYLTRNTDPSEEYSTRLNGIFKQLFTLSKAEVAADTQLNWIYILDLHNATAMQKCLLGQAFMATKNCQSFTKDTKQLVADVFSSMSQNAHAPEANNSLTTANQLAIGDLDSIANVTQVLEFFLQANSPDMTFDDLKMLLNYMPSISKIFEATQNFTRKDQKAVRNLWQTLHRGLCKLFSIKEGDTLIDAHTHIAETFSKLAQDRATEPRNTLKNMIENYTNFTANAQEALNFRQDLTDKPLEKHCKAFFIYLGQYAQICHALGQNTTSNTEDLVTCFNHSLTTELRPDYQQLGNDLSNLGPFIHQTLDKQAIQTTIFQAFAQLTQAEQPRKNMLEKELRTLLRQRQNALQTIENTLTVENPDKILITSLLNDIHAKKERNAEGVLNLISKIDGKVNEVQVNSTLAPQVRELHQELENVRTVINGNAPAIGALINSLLDQLENKDPSNLSARLFNAKILALVFLITSPLSASAGEYNQTLNQLRKLVQTLMTKSTDNNETLITNILENCRWLMWQKQAMKTYSLGENSSPLSLDIDGRLNELLKAPDSHETKHYDRVLDVLSWANIQAAPGVNKQQKARFNLRQDTLSDYLANKPLSPYQAYCLYDCKKSLREPDFYNVIIEMYLAGYLAYIEDEATIHPVDVANELIRHKEIILRMRIPATTSNSYRVALNPQQRDNHAVINYRLMGLLVRLDKELKNKYNASQNLMPFMNLASKTVSDKSALIHVVNLMLLQQKLQRSLKSNSHTSTPTTQSINSDDGEEEIEHGAGQGSQMATVINQLELERKKTSNQALTRIDKLAEKHITELQNAYPGAFKSSTTATRSGVGAFFKTGKAILQTPDGAKLKSAENALNKIIERYKYAGINGSNAYANLTAETLGSGENTAAEKLAVAIDAVTSQYSAIRDQQSYKLKA